ncbi:pyruvate,orthophosphate dikinase [Enterococcus sp. PF1-24]|uniref:pyruvate, phosphate dikinase n=1 Tax=unclassified Enterococcus TaxID=2608891 RepID=UPI002475FBE2|nr:MULTISPECIES: pyruvate, phosphate dikinase [unclassified Enterococcus]MDH6365472.1 pyruvate,orthophosphate dikinase [Enterococcus sp. PFB1-1]MDH6402574.1 pyruvate,orthophosphate dikinase [Enterococcus sp. PF1-24]
MKKFIFDFTEGSKEQKDLLGGKGANLAEMTSIGLPVPPGFTISTNACIHYLASKEFPQSLKKEIQEHILTLETKTAKKFGGLTNPLLISVRSGAKFSMPGMMDTILNLGLNDQSVAALAKKTDNPVFAYDCYRRLLQMFGDVVKGIDKSRFEDYLSHYKKQKNYSADTEMLAEDWQQVIEVYKEIYLEVTQEVFPQDPYQQLYAAVEAVFRSWNNSRAITYRRLNHIDDALGTAVNLQAMVFGNSGNHSGTGVSFTRNPATGEAGLFGEYLINAQGEDVVAGIRTPLPIKELAQQQPKIYQQFQEICQLLEKHYRDMQDIEFTIEEGQLFILQTRNGKRTAKAAFKIAIQLVADGILSKKEALQQLTPEMITQLLHPVFSESHLKTQTAIAKGLPASPGAASGKVYFTAAAAKQASENGEKVILLRQETSPEDIEGMVVSQAIVTSRGGMTSHAAVVARGMGVCCVVGCDSLEVNEFLKQAQFAEGKIVEGTEISVNGTTGEIYLGTIPCEPSQEFPLLEKIISWAKEQGNLQVRANAETFEDIQTALQFGANGIGLARTEHMFFGEERILEMRKLILAENKQERQNCLVILKDYQKYDFMEILRLTADLPCTIRLLDPPLHEFIPKESELPEMARLLNRPLSMVQQKVADLKEINPMLGHRGSRLGVTYPEIYEMQTQAIMEAALELTINEKCQVCPEIMIPLICEEKELAYLKNILEKTIQTLFEKYQLTIPYKIGAMLETPRACLTAKSLATTSEFFSFGTNDLTQLTYGFSRDDSVKFIHEYQEKKLLAEDPFQHLDLAGVGQLMQTAITQVKPLQPEISFGVCGEVGGDPQSLVFLKEIGIDYVSCSPYRVPAAILTIAKLAK